ncbi:MULTISPECIES: CHRD domain-containing protein [unclassified Massilia]|uniref:CHRD domain-containing protein n=1 Tax=unclassified Massilia TaxID=2609279 RepID=UPI00177FD320|nr:MULTISPECIES: CHRD domain-containing protein [unclassified Massilia]MBD8530233.1 CHRD domain-containing protein [Massilia sp. CFBP 13647]MBD8673010.1 CHRD domain-containing protein [Massilia sp. CFBP 13721]
MKHNVSLLALAAALVFAPLAAQAQTTYKAVASGPSESPPNDSPGSSVASFEIDGNLLRAEVPFRDLVGTSVAAHIHCCTTDAFTGTAPIALPFADFPTGVTNGIYSQAFDLSDAATYAPAFLTAFGGTAASAGAALLEAMNGNQAYLNIHTTEFPAGEIRGFVVAAPIPEPATWGMLGLGMAGVGMLARRRRT